MNVMGENYIYGRPISIKTIRCHFNARKDGIFGLGVLKIYEYLAEKTLLRTTFGHYFVVYYFWPEP